MQLLYLIYSLAFLLFIKAGLRGVCALRVCKADWHCTRGKGAVGLATVTSDVCKIVYISHFPEGSLFLGGGEGLLYY